MPRLTGGRERVPGRILTESFRRNAERDNDDPELATIARRIWRDSVVEREIDTAHKRTVMLDDFRRRSKADMDVLEEMTRLLPQQVWLNLLDLNRTTVFISSCARSATQ